MDVALPLLFLDFEASGLGPHGFPVEWGVAVLERGPDRALAIRTESCLVRPEPRWLDAPGAWDPAAERIHGISLERLMDEGAPAAEAARRLDEALAGRAALSDAPRFEAKWAGVLLDAAGMSAGFAVRDVGAAFALVTDLGYEHGLRAAARLAPRTHRAADDARHLATVLKEALENPGGTPGTPFRPAR